MKELSPSAPNKTPASSSPFHYHTFLFSSPEKHKRTRELSPQQNKDKSVRQREGEPR
ncbi:hypothetical protein BHE74_00018002 [Ensete ventricosum]|uniref:Uncharacterized protein n=1 Tax=Ensete ventricosum TaxID=4639 RepID=A0A444EGE5_ENSVE|nr:hypothetical protein B296_00049372 [Ensete ventricosum]RWW09405.1 hypothetical protein GW17_00027113 [Ensete ventricosum]RWW74081.1 hypothetical protein BHE74_00018002 [Ensete ventricosum]RZS28868.1 hypothetical protein BHM03_00062519 [Ensete ventricosum]